ncbi:hypothetical protein [Flavobacterium capsici]|uniref:Uncharacterized protein n=1 Tax=Flavobacterium capsici TaxID=3075618 RepID=A0AA96J4U4_9FLAO|nr:MULTISPECIES: hypothetical protein [unclassified Flavobacterium]WNM18391.1 hypothetical protein RN608_10245 [Flavobacterium sp. PMR2A8]WNM22442.1 hypothetical protein RN605_03545 [Flavobacterium sp. PMTSA4]
MKKHNNAFVYNISNQGNSFLFGSVITMCSSVKKDFKTLITEFELLFQEKLPIIYANIRV